MCSCWYLCPLTSAAGMLIRSVERGTPPLFTHPVRPSSGSPCPTQPLPRCRVHFVTWYCTRGISTQSPSMTARTRLWCRTARRCPIQGQSRIVLTDTAVSHAVCVVCEWHDVVCMWFVVVDDNSAPPKKGGPRYGSVTKFTQRGEFLGTTSTASPIREPTSLAVDDANQVTPNLISSRRH